MELEVLNLSDPAIDRSDTSALDADRATLHKGVVDVIHGVITSWRMKRGSNSVTVVGFIILLGLREHCGPSDTSRIMIATVFHNLLFALLSIIAYGA